MIFDNFTTQASQASLDALWLKAQVITNNLANADTPGYKAQNVSFSQTLSNASRRQAIATGTQAVSAHQKATTPSAAHVRQAAGNGGNGAFTTRVHTNDDTSVRVDGNNVQLEKEQNELWKTYSQYSYLLDRVAGHYNTINNAITGMRG